MTHPLQVDAGLLIRSMSAEDLPQVMAIESASFGSPWSANHFMDELNNRDLSIPLVLVRDQIIVAYAVVWIILDECHVANIAVHPEFRRGGLGDRLMRHIVTVACERACARIMLEVRSSNAPAIGLYERHGFERVGIRKNYYHDGFLKTEDAILMDRDLAGSRTV